MVNWVNNDCLERMWWSNNHHLSVDVLSPCENMGSLGLVTVYKWLKAIVKQNTFMHLDDYLTFALAVSWNDWILQYRSCKIND